MTAKSFNMDKTLLLRWIHSAGENCVPSILKSLGKKYKKIKDFLHVTYTYHGICLCIHSGRLAARIRIENDIIASICSPR